MCAAELCDPRVNSTQTANRAEPKAARNASTSPTTRANENVLMSPTSSSTVCEGEDSGTVRLGNQRPPSPASQPRASSSRHPETPGQSATIRNREEEPRTPPQPLTSRSSSRGSDRSRSARGGSRGRSARGDDKRVIVGRNLYGSLHVAGIRVAAMDGEAGLWFLFTVSQPQAWAVFPIEQLTWLGSLRPARREVSDLSFTHLLSY